jgi:hypothetical protein
MPSRKIVHGFPVCRNGHRMTEANTNPSNQCRICKRAQAAAWAKVHRPGKKASKGGRRTA